MSRSAKLQKKDLSLNFLEEKDVRIQTENSSVFRDPQPIIFRLIEHKEIFEALTDEQAGQLIKAVLRFFADGPVTIQDPVVRNSFKRLRPFLKNHQIQNNER